MVCSTGKSVSEALILESVNPKYDNRLFIDLQLLTQKNTSSEPVILPIPKKSNMYQYLKCTAISISIQNVEKY